MSKTMLVNVTHVEESRVAILEDGVLATYEIETINRTQLKGNIYNAVVENVHPTLEAAFLKISPDLKGFLPLDEVNFNLLPAREESRKSGKIGQHLRNGQKIMAQIVREPFSEKPPTVSTYFSLPGRYLVLMPGVDTAGVSRKIEDPDQRDRLKKIVDELKPPQGFGVIVRTAGLGQTKLELQRDMRYLLRLWQSIQRASPKTEFPALVYREADLVTRTIRDHMSSDIGEVWIDSQETFDKALSFVSEVMPSRAKALRLYAGDRPLFNKYNLEEQIESIYKRRVPLPSGGEIVIDGTEALTAIDVNSARSKRKGDAEETVLKTNIEAAAEAARQLRLRDLGGLIVVDFIDMASTRNKKKVEDAMRTALRGDKARHDMTRISKMGLMEIARQRMKAAKMAAMYNACPTCEGYGLIKTLEAAALAALRKLQTRSARGNMSRIRLTLPVAVADWMLENKKDDLLDIEKRQNIRVEIEPDAKLLRHQANLETFSRGPGAQARSRPVPPRTEPPATEALPAEAVETASAARPEEDGGREETAGKPAAAEGAPRKRRRRRRRSATAPAEAGQSQVLPFSPRPLDEQTAGQAEPADAAESEPKPEPTNGEEGRGGKRRRRRRRSRSSETGGDAPQATPEPPADEDDATIVPRSVRSDELMPAAVGGAKKRRGRDRGGPPPPRRRRKATRE